ncbi:hypothetical protein MESS2_350082 [Mesorhizobium metallidurans STM 2683]|uniref:Uncharacterized protein n=1 Tax=Mesorhizobium metallidurans STM 2683 TaxID=1297569 RepID=M5ERK9_9HYPH|nr:hypothetical protein MESS2_350082 [Mesorhizobium metallidurans STM 2683]
MINLGRTVALPTKATMSAAEIQTTLNADRRLIEKWRVRYGFPRPSRRQGKTTLTPTAEIAAFLNERGCKISWC